MLIPKPLSNAYKIATTPHGKGVFCTLPIQENQVIFVIEGSYEENPDSHTIQISDHKHISTKQDQWAMINHACAPNCRVDIPTLQIISLREIRPDEEITYNYLSTEWELFSPFNCHCQAKNCFKKIEGYRYLDQKQRASIHDITSPFLLSKE